MATIHTTDNLNIIRNIIIGSFSHIVGHEGGGAEPPSPLLILNLTCNPYKFRDLMITFLLRFELFFLQLNPCNNGLFLKGNVSVFLCDPPCKESQHETFI